MHKTQLKILELSSKINVEKLTLRELGRQVDVKHPQVVLYHLSQLRKRGLLQKSSRQIFDKLRRGAEKSRELLANIPILGAANCGIATLFAQASLEDYLKISTRLLPRGNTDGYFVLRADGDSMDRAKINGKSVAEGDFLLIDSNRTNPQDGDYVLSIIDACANVKRFKYDKENERIVLASESTKKYPPIYIHKDDDHLINGLVVSVISNA